MRDTNASRRRITLSKLKKFETLRRAKLPSANKLETVFGPIKNENDAIDVELLFSLRRNVVDFLVTEDKGLTRRGYNVDLGRRIFNISEAETFVRNTFEPHPISLPSIVEQGVYQLDETDPIFASIRQDYPGFDAWFQKCIRDHRLCWTVSLNGKLGAILIFKQENQTEAGLDNLGDKVFKICTLKVGDNARGEKFGEQLLKQCLWYAQRNVFELVYLTVFPKQQALILMIGRLGFEETKTLSDGQIVFEKVMKPGDLGDQRAIAPLAVHRKHYPRFLDHHMIRKFCVPIRPKWHERLFPELQGVEASSLPNGAISQGQSGRPGNTIRKVYICRARTGSLRAGDILLFYKTKGFETNLSQMITTVGIVERVRVTKDLRELLRLTGKRSVFSDTELRQMIDERDTPVVVIDFLLAGHLKEAVPLSRAERLGVLRAWPQTIGRVPDKGYRKLRKEVLLGWEH